MSKIINFRNCNEDESCCPTCQLVEEYTYSLQNAESVEELHDIIRELIDESVALHAEHFFNDGFSVGHRVGYKAALEADIEIKKGIIQEIEEELDKDVCHCDDENSYLH